MVEMCHSFSSKVIYGPNPTLHELDVASKRPSELSHTSRAGVRLRFGWMRGVRRDGVDRGDGPKETRRKV